MNRLKYMQAFISCTVIFVLGVSSCIEVEIDSQKEFPLEIKCDAQRTYHALSLSSDEIVFNINSNTPWEINSDKEWCKVSPSMSSISALIAEIRVNITENDTYFSREAILTISSEKCDQKITIKIEQFAKSVLQIQPIDKVFLVSGGVQEFSVCSNFDWTITSSNDWLTLDKTAGIGNKDEVIKIKATATVNKGAKRKAKIAINNGIDEKTIEVIQDGCFIQIQPTTPDNLVYDCTGGSHQYQISSNIEWIAETVDKEIKGITFNKSGNELTVTLPTFSSLKDRVIEIRITPKTPISGMQDAILSIQQKASVWYEGTKGNGAIFNPNGSVKLNVAQSGSAKFWLCNRQNKLGVYTWKISSMNISDAKDYFNIKFWPDVSPTTANYHLFLGETTSEFTVGGGFTAESKKVAMTHDELSKISEISIRVEKESKDADLLKFTLLINGTVRETISGRKNVFSNPKELGLSLYFGFYNCVGPASCVIESFETTFFE